MLIDRTYQEPTPAEPAPRWRERRALCVDRPEFWRTPSTPCTGRRSWGGQIGLNTRLFLIAYSYLLDGFTAFQRPSLAHRVFGAEVVDDAVRQICAVLAAWGLPPRRRRLTSTICQILLLKRSLLLADLSGDAMAAICDAPAM